MKNIDVFYMMKGVTINSINVTPYNIKNFNLYLRYECEIADIYSTKKSNEKGQFIIHIKRPDLYSKNNNYLISEKFHLSSPEVDWTEEDLSDQIFYLSERL